MKKFLLPLLLLISGIAFGQGTPFPNYQQFGSATTRTAILGAAHGQKGVIIGRYTDTTTANLGYIDYYPGAFIVTDNPVDELWQRNYNATQWINRGSMNITNVTFLTDSSIVFCFGNGVCDTVTFNTNNTFITNNNISILNDSSIIICSGDGATISCDTLTFDIDSISNFYFLNDSTLVACDSSQIICIGDSCYSQQECDTIPIPKITTLVFQNGLLKYPPDNHIVEFGRPFPGEGQGQLLHDTWLYTRGNQFTVEGGAIGRPNMVVRQNMLMTESPGIISFNHWGQYPGSPVESDLNAVKLTLNYITPFVADGDSVGFFGDRIGYSFMGNAEGNRYSLTIADPLSKQAGILVHTKDKRYKDGVTIFAQDVASTYNYVNNPPADSNFLSKRVAVFKTDQDVQFPNYPSTRNDGGTTKALYTDIDGNIKLGQIDGLGDIITIINDTTINICSFGTQLCDTFIINNIGVIQIVTIINDSTLLVCDSVGICDTLHIPQTGLAQPITANNGLIMSTPTNVQLGSPSLPGAPLIHNTNIAANLFTLSFNAHASQVNNIIQTKNTAAAIRARITSNAEFSNTGGQADSEQFGEGATVGSTTSTAVGKNANTGTGAAVTVIGAGATNAEGNSNVIIGASSQIISTGANNTAVLIGSHATSSGNSTIIGQGALSTTRNTGVGRSINLTAQHALGLGEAATVAHTYSQAYGAFVSTTAANQAVFGSNIDIDNASIQHVFFGAGVAAVTPRDVDINVGGGSGPNVAGSIFYINGSRNTGNAVEGPIIFQTSAAGSSGSTAGTLAERMRITSIGTIMNARFEEDKGANVAAANDLTTGIDGNLFTITGSTQINAITTANWQAGSTIGFIFTGAPLLKHNSVGGAGTATMLLAGGIDFQAAAGDNIEFRYDGTNWHEVGRTVAAGTATITADNALRKSTATNVQLGSSSPTGAPLLFDTYVYTNTFGLTFLGVNAGATVGIANQHGSTGQGLDVTSDNGIGASIGTTNGTHSLFLSANPASTNTIQTILRSDRLTQGLAGNGIGQSFDFGIETTAGSTQVANQIISKLTDATSATRTSQLDINGIFNASALSTIMSVYGSGVVGIGISSLYAPTRLHVQDDALADKSMAYFGSASTAAASGLNTGIEVVLSGANANSGQITTGIRVTNSHSGTGSLNYGLYANATGATNTNVSVYGLVTTGSGVKGESTSSGEGGNFISVSGTGLIVNSTSGTGTLTTSISGVALQSVINSTSTNTVLEVARVQRSTQNTAADGIGGMLTFYNETNSGTNQLSNSLTSTLTTADNSTRTSTLTIQGVLSTTTVDLLTLAGNGSVKLRPITATQASAITPAEGMIVIVSDTNGTFTSVGFWGYSGGAWAKF